MNHPSFICLFLFYSISFASQIVDVNIIGNKHSRSEIILREINHPYPAEFDSSMAKEDRNRIYNLGLFSTVDIRPIDSVYTITLVETFRYFPIPLLDYNEAKGWSYGGGISFIKIQTQIGPNENSNNIKKVNSAASKCRDEIINNALLNPATTPPRAKHNNIS